MSDFGAILIIKKTTGSWSAQDKNPIAAALSSIIQAGDYPETIKKGNYKSLISWDNDEAYCSMLTEYYLDDDADENKEFAEEDDMDDAEEIAGKLAAKLGSGYTVTAAFENW